ncbi:hypothetical protein ISN44_As04g015350 [Arabidopsis suecica]|uniref:Uncharacterized protein n=1 Tax=Arabidopsis suecica TaxID=45249 RepID=A0A8T2ELX4_ARASU|nr:hypothetical protein ISN44_As04g015350 [Arabidopsis suecica]
MSTDMNNPPVSCPSLSGLKRLVDCWKCWWGLDNDRRWSIWWRLDGDWCWSIRRRPRLEGSNSGVGGRGRLTGTGFGVTGIGLGRKAFGEGLKGKTFGDDESCVSMVGRWICYSNGWWDFKVDKTRPGKAINCEKIQTFKSLEQVLRRRFSMCTSLVYRSGVLFSCSHFVSRSSSARPSQVAHPLALLKKLISSPFLRNSLARSSSSSFSTRSLHQVPQLVFKLSSSSSSYPARLQALQLVFKLFSSPLSSSSSSARPQAPQLVFKLFPSQRPSPRLAISSSLDCETHLPPRLAAVRPLTA